MTGEGYSLVEREVHGLLGTVVRLTLSADSSATADTMAESMIRETERLQSVFNVFDPGSQLRRWQRGEVDVGAEISEVLHLADQWQIRSRGAFDSHVGRLREVWAAAAAEGRLPKAAEVAAARRERGAESADLNGIAKGWIVDRAVEVGLQVPGAESVSVNAGGDLRHEGREPLRVGIEDPHRPFDNAAPLEVVELPGGAIASSGGARRGWKIAGQWYSHVIDPRSGQPANDIAQASVMAPDACTADAVATALTILNPAQRNQMLAELDEDIGYLLVGTDRSTVCNVPWEERRIS